jgi:hypothetical protein
MVKVLMAFLLTGMLTPGFSAWAQTIITQSGRLVYFNSLDSARAATLARLALAADCWIRSQDPRDSFPVFLDLRPDSSPVDTTGNALPRWELNYDNLYGNSQLYTDSTVTPSDPAEQPYYRSLGLRLRCRDSTPDPLTLLRLLDYGIARYDSLRQDARHCPADIPPILARPPSPRLRAALRVCLP